MAVADSYMCSFIGDNTFRVVLPLQEKKPQSQYAYYIVYSPKERAKPLTNPTVTNIAGYASVHTTYSGYISGSTRQVHEFLIKYGDDQTVNKIGISWQTSSTLEDYWSKYIDPTAEGYFNNQLSHLLCYEKTTLPALLPPTRLTFLKTDHGVKVSWDAVPNATGYITEFVQNGGTWGSTSVLSRESNTNEVEISTGSWSDDGIVDGWLFYYRVIAKGNGTTFLNSDPSRGFGWTRPRKLSTPYNLVADQVTSSSARVRWNAVTNATDYKVEYRVQGATNWTED